MIEFETDLCGDLESALRREWLETNGLGGFASSTISCINTRRYHGLLTAALDEPPGRFVLLSKLEATLVAGAARHPLCANIYPGAVYPLGFQYLKRFRLDPFPVFTWHVENWILEQRLFIPQGENTVMAEYRLVAGAVCQLEIRPLLAFRRYHELTHANRALDPSLSPEEDGISIQPYAGLPRLFFAYSAAELRNEADWFYNFEYPRERERGLDFREDLFSPFALQFEISAGARAVISASTPRHAAADFDSALERENDRRLSLRTRVPAAGTTAHSLFESADSFVVRRTAGQASVIAGYHWFGEWGRDTMVSLPGLALATGRHALAKDILTAWSRSLDQGMLPNRFPDSGEPPEYNTADASLWLFEAARKYLEYTGDFGFIKTALYDAFRDAIEWYLRGTRYGIRCDSDGLIAAGNPGTQLTWMDAKVGDTVITSRHGKPVEIQALWYNALRFAGLLARKFGDGDAGAAYEAMAEKARLSFSARFWNETVGCLFDVIDQPGDDASIRPNQMIALSLGYALITGERARRILAVVERDLLTPFGLRTLAPSDPRYRGRYEGGVAERDGAYHQGTVWPWLLGPFVTAYVRAFGASDATRKRCAEWLAPFEDHLKTAGLRYISEIFDGDAPHEPRGCIAQAWSVAEILRVKIEHDAGTPMSR